MGRFYDADAPKRAVNMTLNEDLVRRAREYAGNLSEQVEKLLVEFVVSEAKRRADEERSIDEAIAGLNAFDDEYGAFADDHAEL
jgi:antitoxin CcdA